MSKPAQRRVLVLGGSGTVGRVLVRELASAGARVAFTYRNGRDVADVLTREVDGVFARALDLRDLAAVAAVTAELATELGGLDAMIIAATKTSTLEPPRFDTVDEIQLDGWDELMTVNVTSAFVAVRSALPFFAGGGNVVFFGSVDGIKPVPTSVGYAVSKAALRGMVLSLSKALGDRNVRVNMVAPGVLEAGASRTLPDDLRAEFLRHAGLRRVGKIDEVTPLAAWLALENTYVTGQTLLVDGGL